MYCEKATCQHEIQNKKCREIKHCNQIYIFSYLYLQTFTGELNCGKGKTFSFGLMAGGKSTDILYKSN